MIDDLLEFRRAVSEGLNDPTPEERRLWLELLQTQVTVTAGLATVTCRLDGGALQVELSTGIEFRIS